MKKVDLRGLIEEQINTFDLDYIEKLIIEIANKELKLIMSLGFILGGIIGFSKVWLQSLSKKARCGKVISNVLINITTKECYNHGSKFI